MKKRISIIIPAYNEERYLAHCLDSIQNQVEKPFEVIVINNNSTDATATIAQSYPFVTVIDEQQQGRVYARNAGFESARGDVLARIDADAILPIDWIMQVSTYFGTTESMLTAWSGGAHFYNVRFSRTISAAYEAIVYQFNSWMIGHPTLWGSNMAMPAKLWDEVKDEVCLRNDIHEDLDLAIHLHRYGRMIVYNKRIKVSVQLRRVRSDQRELWGYLQWWPRTLKVHGVNVWPVSWPITWLFGGALIFILIPFLDISEVIALSYGRKPLDD